jgi:hypothetical protein
MDFKKSFIYHVVIWSSGILLVVDVAEQETEDDAVICLSSTLYACPLSHALLH